MAVQNAENGVVWSDYGALKVIGNVKKTSAKFRTASRLTRSTFKITATK